ncbi:MAG: stage II sporulation protein M [Planctomycetia bacterium]|nr:stage II sporulation protein M [Planctomycetia bacterium]
MDVRFLLEQRQAEWDELEELTTRMSDRPLLARDAPETVARFTTLYRSVCSDLALAESYHLPTGVVQRLNRLVAQAHYRLYRTRRWSWQHFRTVLLRHGPAWLVSDPLFWLCLLLFWGPFLLCGVMARSDPAFAEAVVGAEALDNIEAMYSKSFETMDFGERMAMAGFYIRNNGGIGLQCFALGILGGLGGLYILISNAVTIGVLFGFMLGSEASSVASQQFCEFVTAHAPFELTAIILSAAAGTRMGFAFIATGGWSRFDSVRLAARRATPTLVTAVLLFCLAAGVEAFISPNPFFSHRFKVAFALVSALLLFIYIVVLGLIALAKGDVLPAFRSQAWPDRTSHEDTP